MGVASLVVGYLEIKISLESVGIRLFHVHFYLQLCLLHGVMWVVGTARDHGGHCPTVSGSHITLKGGAE